MSGILQHSQAPKLNLEKVTVIQALQSNICIILYFLLNAWFRVNNRLILALKYAPIFAHSFIFTLYQRSNLNFSKISKP